MYLADKSAVVRALTAGPVRDRMRHLANQGEIATCGMVDLELLYSARNLEDFDAMLAARSGFPRLAVTEDHFRQAIELQRTLAKTGRHRRPIPDLLIASVALLADATVLHYDKDFEIIAEVCELRHEWVAPQGSV